MKVLRQCPLVLLVRWVGEEVRHSVVNKVDMKGAARRDAEQGFTALNYKHELRH
jgi:hypothetical protein